MIGGMSWEETLEELGSARETQTCWQVVFHNGISRANAREEMGGSIVIHILQKLKIGIFPLAGPGYNYKGIIL